MEKFKSIIRGLIASLVLLPSVALAQSPGGIIPQQITGLPGNQGTSFNTALRPLIYIALGIAGLIAVLFIIIGGFQYITSGGNEEQAEAGKKTLTNAIIGLVIVILSYVIVVVIANALVPGGSGV